MARQLDVPPAKLTRILRELTSLETFEYVPPFRGRAIHVLDRKKPFRELQLDFETLARRKAADYAKLDAMVDYARSHQCRQRLVLKYFGASMQSSCGHCDNCGHSPPTTLASDTQAQESHPAIRQAIRMALSGIARSRGKFGKVIVAAMLAGSRSAKIQRWQLDRLSTFGLLSFLKQVEICEVLDALVIAGYARQNEIDRFRPVLELTESGRNVMKNGEANFEIHLRPIVAAKIQAALQQHVVNSAEHPMKSELLPITPLEQFPDPSADFLWTYKILEGGFTLAECTAIRRCREIDVLSDLMAAIKADLDVSIGWVLSADEFSRLQQLVKNSTQSSSDELMAELMLPDDDVRRPLLQTMLGRPRYVKAARTKSLRQRPTRTADVSSTPRR